MSASSLPDFIRANKEPILAEWEAFARTCRPGSEGMDIAALRDHAGQMLEWVADDMETAQTKRQVDTKARGLADHRPGKGFASMHGGLRYQSQFTIPQVFAEFRALRASVIRLWTKDRKVANVKQLQDLNRFNESIDQVVSESVERFTSSLEQSRDMFDAILGHDLRSPLGAIMAGASFLRAVLPPGTQTGVMAHRIWNSGDRMRRLIADLLDFSHLRLGGEMPVYAADMNMEEVCREVAHEIGIGNPEKVIQVKKKGVVSGRWDRERVAQVVSNLIGNAVQYGSMDTPVTVSLFGKADEVLLKIHNWGPGISREEIDRIFEPATRLRKSSGTDIQGNLGLGLHIARLIVVAHGGSIEVESTEEKGTEFTVRWPRG